MEVVLRFLRKLKFLFFRGQFNRELEEEMIFHREQVEKDLERDGMRRARSSNINTSLCSEQSLTVTTSLPLHSGTFRRTMKGQSNHKT
jgi:hypothetical protein